MVKFFIFVLFLTAFDAWHFGANFVQCNSFIMNFDSTLNIDLWLTEASSILQILLTGFFLGVIALARIFIYFIIKTFLYKLNLILREFERISGLKLKMPSIYFSEKTISYMNFLETKILPWQSFVDVITISIKESIKYNSWKFNLNRKKPKEVIFAMFTFKILGKDMVNNGKKIVPEEIDKITGKPVEVIEKPFANKIKEYSETGDAKIIKTHLIENSESVSHHMSVAFAASLHAKNAKIKVASKELVAAVNEALYPNNFCVPRILVSKTINCKYPGRYDTELPYDFPDWPIGRQQLYLNKAGITTKHASVYGENKRAYVDAENGLKNENLEDGVIYLTRAQQNTEVERKIDTLAIYTDSSNTEFTNFLTSLDKPLSFFETKALARAYNTKIKITAIDSMIYSANKEVYREDPVENVVKGLMEAKVIPLENFCKKEPLFEKFLYSLSHDGHTYKIHFSLNLVASEKFINNVQYSLNQQFALEYPSLCHDAKVELVVSKLPYSLDFVEAASVTESIIGSSEIFN